MMFLKKRYCRCCGKVLSRKRTERIVRKGDTEHKEYCSIGTHYKPHGDILSIGKEYFCSTCNKLFSCDEQSKVISAQKHYKRKIVTEDEIKNIENEELRSAVQNVTKLRWALLIPFVGSLICMFYIFNDKLQERTTSHDLHKLWVSSILTFIGVALAIRCILEPFNNVDFINKYQTILMLMSSLLSFNIPTLCYINHKLK